MKKFFIVVSAMLIGLSSFAYDPAEIDEKLIQSFKTSFPAAESVSWSETPESYVVNFVENKVRSRIIYQKDESYVHLTRYYQEQNLPFSVQYKVKKKFPGKRIHGVVEISTIAGEDNNTYVEYFVKMEDQHNWMTVRVDSDGNMRLVEKYRKAL
jgi:hypothetical protein